LKTPNITTYTEKIMPKIYLIYDIYFIDFLITTKKTL
jgi:hypothetical protein